MSATLSAHAILLETSHFAAEKHKRQKRKDAFGTPYINHPLGVATNILKIGGVDDLVTLQGAILHDTVEDTDTTFEELEKHFGKEVADVVREVTDDKSLSKDERKKQQVIHAADITPKAKHVKLADKLYNLRDLLTSTPKGWTAKRVQGYFVWAKFVVDALRGTNAGLEKALDDVFASHFVCDGTTYPALPAGDLNAFLEEYYKDMAKSD